jgi:hypothetical protein
MYKILPTQFLCSQLENLEGIYSDRWWVLIINRYIPAVVKFVHSPEPL